jgi:hypothetical protein
LIHFAQKALSPDRIGRVLGRKLRERLRSGHECSIKLVRSFTEGASTELIVSGAASAPIPTYTSHKTQWNPRPRCSSK